MGFCVCGGAALSCSFGLTPSMLNLLPIARVISGQPVASIMDQIPLLNILPFGMCSSISNPTVAAATAAALGVLTPMPCVPMPAGPWMPGSSTLLIGGKPALTGNSKLICAFGGSIQITMPGTINLMTG